MTTLSVDNSQNSQPSSSIQTKTNFASLLKNSKPTSPIALAPLPTPYTKGSLPAIKLDELVYQKSLQACQLNLIGRLSTPKGSSLYKVPDLYNKINSFWKCREPFTLTPIGDPSKTWKVSVYAHPQNDPSQVSRKDHQQQPAVASVSVANSSTAHIVEAHHANTTQQ